MESAQLWLCPEVLRGNAGNPPAAISAKETPAGMTTPTGRFTRVSVVGPIPSAPYWVSPQQYALPSDPRAQALRLLSWIAVKCTPAGITTGPGTSGLPTRGPSPSCPSTLSPQQ